MSKKHIILESNPNVQMVFFNHLGNFIGGGNRNTNGKKHRPVASH
jgi:hypothetical protein